MTIRWLTTDRKARDLKAPGRLDRFLRVQRYPRPAARAEQVHGDKVLVVGTPFSTKAYPETDGFLTTQSGVPLAIFTADCIPVFLADKNNRMVGLLHAGWRGLRSKILAKAVRLAKKKWSVVPKDLCAWAGPSIGPCCFEVQWDVARYFPATRRRVGSRWHIHLIQELARQARQLGVRWVAKKTARGCTMHGRRYFSYRRDATPDRQVSLIWKS